MQETKKLHNKIKKANYCMKGGYISYRKSYDNSNAHCPPKKYYPPYYYNFLQCIPIKET